MTGMKSLVALCMLIGKRGSRLRSVGGERTLSFLASPRGIVTTIMYPYNALWRSNTSLKNVHVSELSIKPHVKSRLRMEEMNITPGSQ